MPDYNGAAHCWVALTCSAVHVLHFSVGSSVNKGLLRKG